MEKENNTRNRLMQYYEKYPDMQIQDMLKYLYQSSFGCEHMLSSEEKVIELIRKERKDRAHFATDKELIEELDGEYSRVSLSYLDFGLSDETLGRLFCISSKKELDGISKLEEKIDVLKILVQEKKIGFSIDDLENSLNKWRDSGYQSLSHSEKFRASYHPSYRVISNEYVRLLPLMARIDAISHKKTAIIAIEGGSGSGKSTLGRLLCDIYSANLFHMDDFFLRREQRTEERYSEVAGNIDWERFLDEVLIPLRKGEDVDYRRFDCSTMSVGESERVRFKRLNIVEGVYSMHPKLAEYYDMSVFIDISPEIQRERIENREPPYIAKRFFYEWIPLERRYFDATAIKEKCDLLIFNQ